MLSRSALVLFLFPTIVQAQRFDVVSIRVVPPNTPPTMREIGYTSVHPGGQYMDPRVSVGSLILFAYHVPAWFQLTGVPDWANNQTYSISAKPAPDFPALPPAQNTEQVRLMMRTLLAERFHLKLRTDTRQEAVYQLELAKGGIKIQEVAAPIPPDTETPVGFS